MAKRNSFFQYQQFIVYHDKCAMKVGTDGSMLGAWTNTEHAEFALDIGTGSGLLSLMIAQKNPSLLVDAIDVDKDAIIQANENFSRSPFFDRIKCMQTSLQEYSTNKKYDLIISNPPFFLETLKSPDRQRAIARHADSLSLEDLLYYSSILLADRGCLSFIYPHNYKESLSRLANKYGFHITRITNVYPTPQSQAKRILMELSKEEKVLEENNLIIEVERHVYSDQFKNLVKDFYIRRV